MTEATHRGRTSSGFTLVEVLVTIIVLAIGILGVAGLQMAGMRANYSAYLRTQATFAAADLIDRMRVHPTHFADKSFADDADDTDFKDWNDALKRLFPPSVGVTGAVNCTADDDGCGSGNCRIDISWDDARVEATDTEDNPRETGSLQFSVCTRLPEDR